MARTLTVSRVRVRAEAEAEYLASVRELARVAEGRGRRLWVFRKPDEAGTFRCYELPHAPLCVQLDGPVTLKTGWLVP